MFFFESWDAILDFISDIFIWIWESIVLFAVVILEAIPVPSWAVTTTPLQLPSGIAWFLGAFEIPLGLTILSSAWVIRFLIRRLPVIG